MSDRISRRKFLQGAGTATALLYLPSVPEILMSNLGIQNAHAQTTPLGPFLTIVAQGGMQTNMAVSPVVAGGTPWANSLDGTLMGLGGAGTNRSTPQRFGSNGPFLMQSAGGIASSFYSELMTYVTQDIENRTAFLSALVSVPDDARSMSIDPSGLARLAQRELSQVGSIFSGGIGNIPGISGSSQAYTHSGILDRPTLAIDYKAVESVSNAPALIASASTDTKTRFFNTLKNLSTTQARRFLASDLATQVDVFFKGLWDRSLFAIQSGQASLVDPRTDSALVQSFESVGRPLLGLPDTDPRLFFASVARMTALGIAGASSVTAPENYDYHFNSSAAENNALNAKLAGYIGTVLRVWHHHGVRNGSIVVITDGGTSSLGPLMSFSSDRGVASQAWLITYNSTGRVSVTKSYIGQYNQFQAADVTGNNVWAQDTAAIGSALFANYANYNSILGMPSIRNLILPTLGGTTGLSRILAG